MSVETSLDEEAWDRLVSIVQAAHAEDPQKFVQRMQDANVKLDPPAQQKMGLYVRYLLRVELGRKVSLNVPNDRELNFVSEVYAKSFFSVVKRDRGTLEDTFRKVFDRSPTKKEIRTGEMVVFGLAALGILYDNPDESLAAMKPRLNAWWLRELDSMRDKLL